METIIEGKYIYWIPRVVCDHYNITLDELKSNTRSQLVKDARKACVDLFRMFTKMHCWAIGATMNKSGQSVKKYSYHEKVPLVEITRKLHVIINKEREAITKANIERSFYSFDLKRGIIQLNK